MKHQESDSTLQASSGGGDIPFWKTSAGKGNRPGVLLIPAIFGGDEGTKTLARELAASGAHVWIVDPFWRTSNPGVIARGGDGFSEGGKRASELDNDLLLKDLADLIEAMGKQKDCNGKVVALGICFAGKFAVLLAGQGHAVAGATFHGTSLKTLPGLTEITAPLALHFGDADVATSIEDVETLREIFRDQNNVEIILHDGDVKHGFGDPGSDGFHPEVYEKATASVLALLDGQRS